MNIFVLDDNPAYAATMHCDKHVVKMVTETAQLLSSALILSGAESRYKLTHKNHPCAIWARASLSNYLWLMALGMALYSEYQHRYGNKQHKAGEYINHLYVNGIRPHNILNNGLTPFALCMPDVYKCDDAVKSYRAYYMGEKKHILKFKNRQPPQWLPIEMVL